MTIYCVILNDISFAAGREEGKISNCNPISVNDS